VPYKTELAPSCLYLRLRNFSAQINGSPDAPLLFEVSARSDFAKHCFRHSASVVCNFLHMDTAATHFSPMSIVAKRSPVSKQLLSSCSVFGRPFVKRFALFYRTVVLSVCPVCNNVGLLWPNGWTITMKLGTQVGLGPGHTVLDGIQLPRRKGEQPPTDPQFSAMSVVAKRLDGSRCHLVGK